MSYPTTIIKSPEPVGTRIVESEGREFTLYLGVLLNRVVDMLIERKMTSMPNLNEWNYFAFSGNSKPVLVFIMEQLFVNIDEVVEWMHSHRRLSGKRLDDFKMSKKCFLPDSRHNITEYLNECLAIGKRGKLKGLKRNYSCLDMKVMVL